MTDYYSQSAQISEQQVSAIQSRTFLKMFLAMVVSAITAGIMVINGIQMNLAVCIIGLLVIVAVNWILMARIDKASPISLYFMLGGEAIYMGALIGGTLQYYAPAAGITAFIVSAMYFGGLCLAGWITKKDMTHIGNVSIVALFCLIIAEIILMFIHVPVMTMVCAAVALIIFAGLTLKDAQDLRLLEDDGSRTAENVSTFLALRLYLDMVNIFVNILQLIGGSSKN